MENNCTLIGHVGKDPKIQATRQGGIIASFSLATSRNRQVDGEWKKETEWHNIRVFGNQAKTVEKFVTKGKLVGILGMIHYHSWEDKEGVMHYMTQILANRVILLSKKDGTQRESHKEQETSAGGGGFRDDEDDLPF